MSETRPSIVLDCEDFSPGFLDTPEPDTLPRGATPDAKNAFFYRLETQDRTRATMRRRKGCRLINPTAIASGAAIDGIWQFDREGADSELVVMCDGALYVWDGVDAFTAITDGGGFTAGNDTYAIPFKNNLIVSDGTVTKRYDGTACFTLGFVAPTGAPTLTVGSTTGVTGTYEGFAVWVEEDTGHESSPSAITSAVAFTDDKRVWAKPAGSPPANVTHWRVYCRRTDTNENNFFKTGTDQAVATASYEEATSDAARRDIGPLTQSNDVPPAFALTEEYKGYRIGVKANSSDLYISKQFDAESQAPRDVFPVGGRGEAKPVRSVRKYGEDCFVRKPTKTYRLVGDRVPFAITPVDSSYGSVSQAAGIEIDGLWYDWDEQRGPYVSDMNSLWSSLADDRIAGLVGTVNRVYLSKIRVAHYVSLNIVQWAIPTTSSRKRTIIAYNYRLKRWLPPITGMEYASMCTFTTNAGASGLYFGDEWGRVYEMYSGEVDGVPSGSTSVAITVATSGSITADAASFYTTGDGLAGMPAAVRSPSGAWQWVRIQSNTATVLTLDTSNGPALAPVPDGDGEWLVVVGGIEWYWDTPRLTGGNRMIEKRPYSLAIEGGATSSSHQLEVKLRYNRGIGFDTTYAITFPSTGMAWGTGTWGTDAWGAGGTRAMRKHRLNRSFFDVQIRVQNFYPNQPFEITAYVLTADWQTRRRVASV